MTEEERELVAILLDAVAAAGEGEWPKVTEHLNRHPRLTPTNVAFLLATMIVEIIGESEAGDVMVGIQVSDPDRIEEAIADANTVQCLLHAVAAHDRPAIRRIGNSLAAATGDTAIGLLLMLTFDLLEADRRARVHLN